MILVCGDALLSADPDNARAQLNTHADTFDKVTDRPNGVTTVAAQASASPVSL